MYFYWYSCFSHSVNEFTLKSLKSLYSLSRSLLYSIYRAVWEFTVSVSTQPISHKVPVPVSVRCFHFLLREVCFSYKEFHYV